MKAPLPLLIGAGLAAGALLLAVGSLADQYETPVQGALLHGAELAEGRDIYGAQCAACHGERMEGQPDWRSPLPSGRMPAPPHDATGHTWHHPDDVLFRIVRDGTAAIVGGGYASDMPGFGAALTDPEIRAVLAYLKSTWPERERAFQEAVSRAE